MDWHLNITLTVIYDMTICSKIFVFCIITCLTRIVLSAFLELVMLWMLGSLCLELI